MFYIKIEDILVGFFLLHARDELVDCMFLKTHLNISHETRAVARIQEKYLETIVFGREQMDLRVKTVTGLSPEGASLEQTLMILNK